ncbi:unnamed protein product [Cladocopium goreaui]|uniref:Uncharacterized protein n=1 Tax=Cladocopium goreaui TaxID=2562237 RepID=A0A9P1CDB8_9DINO|nr:unnamed protein product [Cladocopium goreaui]
MFVMSRSNSMDSASPMQGAVVGAVPTSGRTFPGVSSGRRRSVSSLLQRGLPDGDGYHDMILPCGLFQEEVIELMYRDLNPEDYDLLNKLDERVSKKNTMGRNAVERLPRRLAKECECTQSEPRGPDGSVVCKKQPRGDSPGLMYSNSKWGSKKNGYEIYESKHDFIMSKPRFHLKNRWVCAWLFPPTVNMTIIGFDPYPNGRF